MPCTATVERSSPTVAKDMANVTNCQSGQYHRRPYRGDE